jgi:hypothetical protein
MQAGPQSPADADSPSQLHRREPVSHRAIDVNPAPTSPADRLGRVH